MLKKTILLTPIIIFVFLLSGCNLVKKAVDLYDHFTESHVSEYDKEYEEGVALCEEVIRCLDEDDKDALKMMFSPHVRNSDNFNERFNELFDFYDGKSVSHDDIAYPDRSGKKEDGKWIYEERGYDVYNLECDSEQKYTIRIFDCVAYPLEDHIGLQNLTIIDHTNKQVSVGLSYWEEDYD